MQKAEKQHVIKLIEADQLQTAFDILKEIKDDEAEHNSPQLQNIILHAITDQSPLIQAATCKLLHKLNPQQQKESIDSLLEENKQQSLEALFYNSHKLEAHKKLRTKIIDTLQSSAAENRSLGLIKAASFAVIAQNPNTSNPYLKKIMEGESEQAKKGLIQALYLLDEKTINNYIKTIFSQANSKYKTTLIEVIDSFESDEIKNTIIDTAFKDNNADVTDTAIEAIKHFPVSTKKKILARAITSSNILLKLKAGQIIEQETKSNPEEFASLKTMLDASLKNNAQLSSLEKPEMFLNTKEKEIAQWLTTQDLGKLPADIAKPLLEKALEDPSESARLNAIRSVYLLPWQTASPIIEKALTDAAKSVRWEATSLLQYLPIAHALPLLAIAFKDEDYYVRQQAVVSLGKNYSKVTEPLLIRALGDKSEYVRAEAAKYIYKFSSKIKEHLKKALSDSEGIVRSAAGSALTHLDPHTYKDILNTVINASDSKMRAGVAQGIYNFQGEALNKAINFLLKDPSDVVRRKIFQNIDKLKENQIIIKNIVQTGINDSAAQIRLEALKNSTLLDKETANAIQMNAVKDSEDLVKAQALTMLAKYA